jgi:hypothetical protein
LRDHFLTCFAFPLLRCLPSGVVLRKRLDRSALPPSPLRFKTTLTPSVRFNAAGLKGVRYGYRLCSAGPGVVLGWGHIGVCVACLVLIGVSVAHVILYRSIRWNHNVILEVAYTFNDLNRVFSFFLSVCLCASIVFIRAFIVYCMSLQIGTSLLSHRRDLMMTGRRCLHQR